MEAQRDEVMCPHHRANFKIQSCLSGSCICVQTSHSTPVKLGRRAQCIYEGHMSGVQAVIVYGSIVFGFLSPEGEYITFQEEVLNNSHF